MARQNKPQVSNRKQAREKIRQQQRRQRLIVLGIIGLLVAILVGVAIYTSVRQNKVDLSAIAYTPSNPRPQVNGNATGDPNAPVKVEIYSDFQCPGCLQFYKNLEARLIEQYVATGKVIYIYHTTGLWVGPESLSSAEAAYCASDQGKFWEYHDILFQNWNGENQGAFSDPRLIAFAQKIGLEMDSFKTCLNGHQNQVKATQDRETALSMGITSTPTLVINGKIMPTALSYDNLAKEIEAALAAAGK